MKSDNKTSIIETSWKTNSSVKYNEANDTPLTKCAACGKVVNDSDVEVTNMCASCEGLEN